MNLGPFAFEEVACGLATSATQEVSKPWMYDREIFHLWNPPRWVYRLHQTEDLLHEHVTVKNEERLAYWRSYSSFSARLGVARECAIIGGAATPRPSSPRPQGKGAVSPELATSKKGNLLPTLPPASLYFSPPSNEDDGSGSRGGDAALNNVDTLAKKRPRCHRLALELVPTDPIVRPLWLSRCASDYSEWRVDLYLRSESQNPSILISVGPFFCPYATELGVLSNVLSIPEDRFLLFPPNRRDSARSGFSFSEVKIRSTSPSAPSRDRCTFPPCPFSPFPPTSEERQSFDKKMLYTPLIWEEPFTVSAEINAKEISVWSEFGELYGQRVHSTGFQKVCGEPQRVETPPSAPPADSARSEEGAAASIPSSPHAAGTVDNGVLPVAEISPLHTHSERKDLWGLMKDELPFTTSLPLKEVPLYEMYLRLEFRSRTYFTCTPKREIEVEFSVGTQQNSKTSEKKESVQGTYSTRGESTFRQGSLTLSALLPSSSLKESFGTEMPKAYEGAKQEREENSGEKEVSSCESSASSVTSAEVLDAEKDFRSNAVEEFQPLQPEKEFLRQYVLRSPGSSRKSKAVVNWTEEAGSMNTMEELHSLVENESTFPIHSLPDDYPSPSSTSPPLADVQKVLTSFGANKSEKSSAVDSLRTFLPKPKNSTPKRIPYVKWKKVEAPPLRFSLPPEASPLVFCPYVTLMSSGDAVAVIGGSCGGVKSDTRWSAV